MYDFNKIKTRTLPVKLVDGKVLYLQPPKLSLIKKLMSIAQVKEEDINEENAEEHIDELADVLAGIVSTNTTKYKINKVWILENMSMDEMMDFAFTYIKWVNRLKVKN